jgi:hypothetical protein
MDMTVECIFAKLAYLLGKKEYSMDQVQNMMKTNLRGELTDNSAREVDKFSMKNNKMIMAINNYMKSSRSAELGTISSTV